MLEGSFVFRWKKGHILAYFLFPELAVFSLVFDWAGYYKVLVLCSWMRHRATSRKVPVSNPVGVIGIFYLHNPSGRTKALGSTQPLTEMCTRNISLVVKTAGA